MDKKLKIDFIKNIMSADLSGASMNNVKKAEKVRKKILSDSIDIENSDDKTINKLICMLGYAQILKK